MVEEGLVLKPTQKQIKNRIHTGSLYDLFLLLTVMVDLDKTADVIETACFHFTDVDLHFVLKVNLNIWRKPAAILIWILIGFLEAFLTGLKLNFLLFC